MSRFTPQQQAAVDAPVANLLVTAAAGAGKTHVLTGRVIRRITHPEHPVDVDRLLIVTFTKAAAAEMRERIDKAISSELLAHPEATRLKRQLPLLGNASISTIDAFCQKTVREFFYRLDIDPAFRVLDNSEAAVLCAEAIGQVMEDLYGEENPDFCELCRVYGSPLSDENVADAIRSAYYYFASEPFPHAAMQRIRERYETSDEENIKSKYIDIKSEICEIINIARAALEEASDESIRAKLEEIIENAEETLARPDEEKSKATGEWKPRDCPTAKAVPEEEKEIYRHAVKKIEKIRSEIAKMNGITPESEALERQRLLPVLRGLFTAVCRMEEYLEEEKKKRNAWSFSDIAKMCLRLVNGAPEGEEPYPSAAAKEIAARYDEIYIDEYQDCNNIQEWIFRLISGEWEDSPNLFMVGDLKQSIYRFRRSNPGLFRMKKETYERREEAHNRKIELTKNFRSRREVVAGINAIFAPIMTVSVGDVDYRDGEELVFGADTYGAPESEGHECELLLADMGAHREESEASPGSEEAEAALIGHRIRELISSGQEIYDKKENGMRPVRYRDIAVLLRTRGQDLSRVSAIRAALEAMGIPVYAKEEGGFYDTLEIRTFFATLQVVDNPRQDIPLAALMRSSIARFSEEEMTAIRMTAQRAEYYDALVLCAGGEGALAEKCRRFLRRLDGWREKSRRMQVDEFISYLLEDTGWMTFVGVLPDGDLRQQNLRVLHRDAAQFEEAVGGGLYRFLSGIEKARKIGRDAECAHRAAGETDVVSVMSIHQSKGLEYPVVFVAFLGNPINQKEESGKVLTHPEAGIGLRFVDQNGVLRENFLYRSVSEAIRKDLRSEEMRIMYVAMTRAREKLILVGHLPNAAQTVTEWKSMPLPGERDLFRAENYLEWFGPPIVQAEEKFAVRVIPRAGLLPTPPEERTWSEEEGQSVPQEAVEEALSYRYPYEPLATIPPLFTVTELKGMAHREEEDDAAQFVAEPKAWEISLQEEETGLSAARRGTVHHFVMQHLPLSCTDVHAEIKALVERELLTAEEAAAVDETAIAQFLRSPLANRMRKAKELHRESPFMMKLPCREIPGLEAGGEEGVVVQGIIDCWFEEEDKVVIVDYKTDRTGDVNEIKKRYQVQMELYEKALSLKKMKKNSEKFIYLFYNGSIVEM